MAENAQTEFEKAGAEEASANLLLDFWLFLRSNKKWWLVPILVTLLAMGVLIILASTGLAPFIYTIF